MFQGTKTTVRQVPRERTDCGWYNVLPAPPPARRVEGENRAEWAIIGAGIAGLSVARRLAEHRPDDRILLIDATRVGLNASGRNSGFMLNYSPHGSGSGDDFDAEKRYRTLLQAGVAELRRLVAEQQIQCDWNEWGRLYLAVGDDGTAHLNGIAEAHARNAVEHRWLDAAECAGITGSGYYCRGLWAAGSALVNPAALVRGLATTLPVNVSLLEESPVGEIDRGSGFRLSCPEGTVECENLILTAGAHAPNLGAFRHRLLGIATYASMTRPLTVEERARFGETAEFGLLPAAHNGSTVRLTRDGRIVMRNSYDYAGRRGIDPEALTRAQANHREAIRRRWPDLGDIELEHTWGGIIAYTRNQGALFGQLGDKLYGVVGADAGPMTRGTITGKLLADDIVGVEGELLTAQRKLAKAGWLPPDPILGFAVNRRLAAFRRDGADEL